MEERIVFNTTSLICPLEFQPKTDEAFMVDWRKHTHAYTHTHAASMNTKNFRNDFTTPPEEKWVHYMKMVNANTENSTNVKKWEGTTAQLVIFKPLSYCFEEAIGFDVKASSASRPVSRLIRWYNKPGNITKEFWEKAIQFHETFHGFKITNWARELTWKNSE